MRIAKNCYRRNQSLDEYSSTISRSGEIEQEFQEFQPNTAITPCITCNSTKISLVPMPANSPHYAKRVCTCGVFRGWETSPENRQRQERQQLKIAILLDSPQLSEWERTFLKGLESKKLSPKQQEILTRIEAQVGGDR